MHTEKIDPQSCTFKVMTQAEIGHYLTTEVVASHGLLIGDGRSNILIEGTPTELLDLIARAYRNVTAQTSLLRERN